MNKNTKLLVLIVTVFLLACSVEVECRRTYSSRSSSSGRGNRGKNQPSSGGLFSSWFGGSKTGSSGSSSGSGSGFKSAPASSSKNWQTASSHATGHSKPTGSGWANPYYKSPGSAAQPSAPKEPNYGWKPATATQPKPAAPYPSSNIGSRGYPVQSGVQQASHNAYGSSVHQPAQSNFGGYRPASNVPGSHATGYHPSGTHSTGYHPSGSHAYPSGTHAAGYNPAGSHSAGYHPSGTHGAAYNPSATHGSYGGYHPPQTSHGYQPSHVPSYSGGYHPSYSAPSGFSGAVPSYQGTKLFGGSGGHYGYPGSGSWGIDTYGSRKSSGTGKLLTGLAVGAAGGYLTSSLVNRISNPWKYSGYGYGYGSGYGSSFGPGFGSSYGYARDRDESAFERGFERGIQARENNNNNNNNNNKEAAAAPAPEDPSSKWIQCVAFDPQTQQTLINPNCSCTVTTSLDERTGQPLSVHHCTTLNGLVLKPVPARPDGADLPPPSSFDTPSFQGPSSQPVSGVNSPEVVPVYGSGIENFQYGGGATVYIPPQTPAKVAEEPNVKEAMSETKTEKGSTEATESKTESATGSVTERETTDEATKAESVAEGSKSEALPEELAGALPDGGKRTAEFYGRLQKIVNMGNFVDGG